MDISFYCDKCGQHIVIDEAGAGQLVECPKCAKSLLVPSKSVNKTAMPPSAPAPPPSMIAHQCGMCGKAIETDAAKAGQVIDCPKCGLTVNVPNAADKTAILPGSKKCPFCAEEIRADAKKCKHCGEFLNGEQGFGHTTTNTHTSNAAKSAVLCGDLVLFYILACLIPVVGFFVGIYLLAKKEPGHGVACMAISVINFLICVAMR